MSTQYGLVLGLAALLVGCASTQSVSLEADSIRTETNLRTTKVFADLTFPQVQSRLYQHRNQCDINFDFSLQPNEVHYASVYYGLSDQTEPAEQALLDLTYFANGKLQVKGYTYYNRQAFLVDAFLQALAKPEQCPVSPAKTK